jgi:hypothetical protein
MPSDDAGTTVKPPHPLVVDAVTGLCRYATQADVSQLESISAAYRAMIEDARERVAAADRFIEHVEAAYAGR